MVHKMKKDKQTNTNNVNKTWALLQTTGDRNRSSVQVGLTFSQPEDISSLKHVYWCCYFPELSNFKMSTSLNIAHTFEIWVKSSLSEMDGVTEACNSKLCMDIIVFLSIGLAITCFSCKKISFPRECRHVVHCSDNEVSYI